MSAPTTTCAKTTATTIGGNTWPNDRGQSGTASPDPVLVTRPPTKRSIRVAPAVTTARRWIPGPDDSGIGSVGRGRRGRRVVESPRLRQIVLGNERGAVLVGPGVHRGVRRGAVAVWGRVRGR